MGTAILIGNVLQLRFQSLNSADVPTDADLVTFTIEPLFGAPVVAAPSQYDSPSIYSYFWKPDVPGHYTVRVEAINPDFADENQIYVAPSGIT